MIRRLTNRLAKTRRDENGHATIEFAIMLPIFITMFLSSVELGMITMRHTMLERGLDLAVRDLRLGTGNIPDHDALKEAICDYAGFIPQCDNNLKLEMRPLNVRNFANIPGNADCTDQSEPVEPARTFTAGKDNELMILRACAKFKAVFPLAGLGYQLQKDAAGFAAMVSTSAFVQEPS